MNLPLWLQFSLWTILISTPFYWTVYRSGGAQSERFERIFRRLMWIPGIVAFGMRVSLGLGFDDVRFGIGRSPGLLLVALLLPLVMEVLVVVTATRFGLARLDHQVIAMAGGRVHISPSVRLVLGSGPQSGWKFALNLTATVATAAFYMLVFSLLEEFGWRGFLQDRIMDSLGLSTGLLVGGLIWGLWHAPLVWMGYKFPDYPRLGALIYMPVFTISLAAVAGWLYWLSGSIWVPALLNASVRVSALVSEAALGEAGRSRRVRFVWLWLWAVAAGLVWALWRVSTF